MGGARGRPYGSSTNVLNYKSLRKVVDCQMGLQTGSSSPVAEKPSNSKYHNPHRKDSFVEDFVCILFTVNYCQTFKKMFSVVMFVIGMGFFFWLFFVCVCVCVCVFLRFFLSENVILQAGL